MGEISNEPLTGSRWATHHVVVWLENDRRMAEECWREIRTGALPLSVWVGEVLYGKGEALTADERHTVRQVRDSFTAEDFDGINWSEVRDSLLTE